jgi:hypothetical protein
LSREIVERSTLYEGSISRIGSPAATRFKTSRARCFLSFGLQPNRRHPRIAAHQRFTVENIKQLSRLATPLLS